jgi:polysaccharide biosynthesis transport protein
MNEGLDLRYYLFVVKRRFLHFLAPMLGTLVLGTAIILSLPRIYNSTAKILVESPQVEFQKLPTANFATERIQQIQQRILTRQNLLSIADKYKLFENSKNMSKTDMVDAMRASVIFDLLELANANKVRGNERLAIVFAVGFDHESPDAANKVANELVNIVLEEDSSIRTTAANQASKLVERELSGLKRNLGELDAKISEFKITNSDKLPEKLTFNMQLIERQQSEIADIDRAEIEGRSQKRLLEIDRSKEQVGAAANGQEGTGDVSTLEKQLAELQSQYLQKKVVYSETHPVMRSLKSQISVTSRELDKLKLEAANAKPMDSSDPLLPINLKLIAQRAEIIDDQLKLNAKRKDSLTKSVDALREIITKTPEIGAQLQSLERTRVSLQDQVDEFQVRLQDANRGKTLVDEQVSERFEVIETPVLPQEPIRPKRGQLMIMALAASLGIGGATAFGTEFLDNTIRRGRDITHKLNSRLIVTIPYVKTRGEVRRSRGRAGLYVLGTLAAIAIGLLLIHLLVTPLDILFFTTTNKLGL